MIAATGHGRPDEPGRGRFPVSSDEQLWAGELSVEALFGRSAPLEVEVGSGKARFLVEAAAREPRHDFLGLELSLAYYRICRDRVARAGLANARVLRADGRRFVETLSPGSVRAFHAYFPDPWPKKRQRKRRLFDAVSLEVFASRLEPGGILRIATDHPEYGSRLAPLLASVPSLETLPWDRLPEPPATHYELKYRAEGRPIWRYLLRRKEQ